MSGITPFTGLGAGTSGPPSNPMAKQLGRIGAFRQAIFGRQMAIEDYARVNEHAHDLQKDLITHASREDRRTTTHRSKIMVQTVEGLRSHGVDAAAPGRTRVKMEGLEIDTVRPQPKKKGSGGKKTPGSSTTPTAPAKPSTPTTPVFKPPTSTTPTFKSP